MSITHELCLNSVMPIVGFDPNQINRTIIPTIFEYIPSGISSKQLFHFGQIVKAKQFQQFDFLDNQKNREAYGTVHPPEYDLSKAKVPISMFFGADDDLVVIADAEELARKLKKSLYNLQVIDKWNHVDFLFGLSAKDVVYNKMLEAMRKGPKI